MFKRNVIFSVAPVHTVMNLTTTLIEMAGILTE
jgi:hypothetical protein